MKYILCVLMFLGLSSSSLAGNCTGAQCGCHGCGTCWSFQYSNSKPGDPWCYTQTLGAKKGQGSWAGCKKHNDCSWEMTCGSNTQLFFGSNPEHFIDVTEPLPSDTASRNEIEITIIKLRAQKDLKVAELKFNKALTLLEAKYEQLLKDQSETAKAERKKTAAVIRDLCRMAEVKIPDAYRE